MVSETNNKSLGRGASFLIIGGIIIAAGLLILLIYSSEPTAQREGATKKTAMLVDVEQVQRGTFTPQIEGLGTVQAAQDIILSPRIDGQVLEIASNFIPGGFIQKGDVLLKIDPADYENMVLQMESALNQAKAELDIELGRRDVARKEYDLLGQNLSEENKALVLREPQLATARASVSSAEAALNQAKLNLQRTTIFAPFDAQILSRNVNVGSQVDPGMELARMVGIEEYWVIVSLPVTKLERVGFPENNQEGAKVTIKNRTAWADGAMREGRVKRLIGSLDGDTRLARVLVSVEDPLSTQDSTQGPKMLVGSVVQTLIEGTPLRNVFRIERDYLREGDTLWLKRDGKLVITETEVVFKDKDYAYLSSGMNDGDLLVTSNLATVAEGVGLRTEEENDQEAPSSQSGAEE